MNLLDDEAPFQEGNEEELKLLLEAFPKQKFSRVAVMIIAMISVLGCIVALMIRGNQYEILGKWVGLIASGSLSFGLWNTLEYTKKLKLINSSSDLFWKGEYLLWLSILVALVTCIVGLIIILSWQL